MDIWNSDFVLNTKPTSSLVSLRHSFVHFHFKGILISVPYLLCHYTPTIEVYWNGPKLFCASVQINKKVRFRASSTIPCPTKISFSSNFNALTSRIVFSNVPAFALRTFGALETNASAPILLTAAWQILEQPFELAMDETYKRHHLLHLEAHYP